MRQSQGELGPIMFINLEKIRVSASEEAISQGKWQIRSIQKKQEDPLQGEPMIDSLSSEELQFIKAIEKYKSENSKHLLSWTEVLKIIKKLGYKKVSTRPQPELAAPEK